VAASIVLPLVAAAASGSCLAWELKRRRRRRALAERARRQAEIEAELNAHSVEITISNLHEHASFAILRKREQTGGRKRRVARLDPPDFSFMEDFWEACGADHGDGDYIIEFYDHDNTLLGEQHQHCYDSYSPLAYGREAITQWNVRPVHGCAQLYSGANHHTMQAFSKFLEYDEHYKLIAVEVGLEPGYRSGSGEELEQDHKRLLYDAEVIVRAGNMEVVRAPLFSLPYAMGGDVFVDPGNYISAEVRYDSHHHLVHQWSATVLLRGLSGRQP
jgi:hypothetical protein